MAEHIERSKRILEAAIARFKPYAIVSMVSGGNDSATANAVAEENQVPVDAIVHVNTRTGIQETNDFVHDEFGSRKAPLLEADAGDAYEKYLFRKGFHGRGENAHDKAWHTLKAGPLRKLLSANFRQGQRGRNILLLNGARGAAESDRRGRTKTKIWNFDSSQPRNIWVNHILHFTNEQKEEYLHTRKVEINPVTKKLCRSGECMCGTMQTKAERIEAAMLYPKWGAWIDSLEAQVKKIWPWGWGEEMPEWVKAERAGQPDMFNSMGGRPMCQGCTINKEPLTPTAGRRG